MFAQERERTEEREIGRRRVEDGSSLVEEPVLGARIDERREALSCIFQRRFERGDVRRDRRVPLGVVALQRVPNRPNALGRERGPVKDDSRSEVGTRRRDLGGAASAQAEADRSDRVGTRIREPLQMSHGGQGIGQVRRRVTPGEP